MQNGFLVNFPISICFQKMFHAGNGGVPRRIGIRDTEPAVSVLARFAEKGIVQDWVFSADGFRYTRRPRERFGL